MLKNCFCVTLRLSFFSYHYVSLFVCLIIFFCLSISLLVCLFPYLSFTSLLWTDCPCLTYQGIQIDIQFVSVKDHGKYNKKKLVGKQNTFCVCVVIRIQVLSLIELAYTLYPLVRKDPDTDLVVSWIRIRNTGRNN